MKKDGRTYRIPVAIIATIDDIQGGLSMFGGQVDLGDVVSGAVILLSMQDLDLQLAAVAAARSVAAIPDEDAPRVLDAAECATVVHASLVSIRKQAARLNRRRASGPKD